MDLKQLQEQLGGVVEEFKKARDAFHEEKNKFGEATQETKNMIDKLNQKMDELKTRIDEIETKANRPAIATGEGGEQKGMTPEQKKAFFKFIREGKAGMTPEERKALVQDTAGEILVPEALDNEIVRELPKITIARQLAQVRNINTNRQRRRSMDEVTVVWGKLETGLGSTWAQGESDLTPDEEYIYVEDVFGWTTIGEDELEDSDVNLQTYLSSSYARAFAEAEDTAMFVGTGHANGQPEGILNSTVGTFDAGQPGAVTADDFIKLPYQVKAQYRRNAAYVVNSQTELALRLLKDGYGQYLWQPSLAAGKPATFNGYPVYTQ
ncbi:phage major capsid protein, partial [Aeribacillus pallidus]|uniref:phage major capsid protein n=1 Tax=Aeribacillus pallidus TaxID=33936 RepID=UPI003D20F8FB